MSKTLDAIYIVRMP